MAELSPELVLLQNAVRANLVPTGDGDLLPLLASRVDWPRVLWLGRQEGALLLLDQALQKPSARVVCPPEVLAQLESLRQVNQFHSLARARALCLLHDLFEREGIPAVPLDRWLIARRAGITSTCVELGPYLRYVVNVAHRPTALVALEAAGHPTEADLQKLIHKNHSPVLLDPRFQAPPVFARLWAAARPVALGGRRLHCLSPRHTLLERIGQQRHGQAPSLIEAWELVLLGRQLDEADWSGLGDEAAAFGLRAAWPTLAAACYDRLDLPRPPALATLPALPPIDTQAEPPAVDRVPFLPSTPAVTRRMLALADTGPDDTVCDLGCGDGRLVVVAAQHFGARGFGIDIDPARIAEATARATAAGVADRVHFACGDLFDQDLSETTVLCLYLLPGFFPRLREKLRREARPGLRIVSHDYTFPGWPPEKTEIIRIGPGKVSQIYLWRMP